MCSLKLVNQEISRFLIIGLINTIVSWALFLTLDLFMYYVLAYTYTYISCIIISYILNSIFVFNQSISLKGLLKYPIVFLIQYIILTPSLIFFVEVMNFSKMLAIVLVTIILTPITFIVSKFIIKQK